MAWLPIGRDNDAGWRLDVVSLLAILGESLMARHIQPLTSSKLCLLPRLIPAPQAFLRSSREARLSSLPAIVCGVSSGILVHELNYFGNILHPISDLNTYDVAVYNISWATAKCDQRRNGILRSLMRFMPNVIRQEPQHLQQGALVPPYTWSPVNILTVISFLLTIGTFTWALSVQDGAAALALVAMSAASTLIGIAFHWRPRLAARPTSAPVPKGPIVIRTRNGAFIIIRCSEEVARELYTGPEECNYLVNDQWFRVLVGLGTLLVITSVLLLGNCNWTMQIAVAGVYIILNALYWLVSLFPRNWLWDLSRYKCTNVTPAYLNAAHKPNPGRDDGESPSYTRSLWYAIQATKEVNLTTSGAAPRTPAWEEWLKLANANCGNQDWNAVAEKDRLMMEARTKVLTGCQVQEERAPVEV